MKALHEHLNYCYRFMDYITNGNENDFQHAKETLIDLMTKEMHWGREFNKVFDEFAKATFREEE